jgi:hypothetical protein
MPIATRKPAFGIWLGVVAACALIAIALTILRPERGCTPDSQGYLSLASELSAHGRYDDAGGAPHVFWPPLYPLFLALFGPQDGCPPSRAVAAGILLGQLALFLGSVLCVRRIARDLGADPRLADGAAIVYGLTPVALVHVGRFLSETLFLALASSGFLLLLRSLTQDRRRPVRVSALAGAAGLCFGLAALTRTILLPWLLVLPVAALARRARRREWLLAFAGSLLVVAPWVARNHAACGRLGFSTAGGTNALRYAARLIASEEECQARLRARRGDDRLADPFRESDARMAVAWEIVGERPAAFARQALRTSAALWAPPVADLLQSMGAGPGPVGTLDVLRSDGPGAAARHLWRRLSAPEHRISPAAAIAVVLIGAWDLGLTALGLLGLAAWAFARAGRAASRIPGGVAFAIVTFCGLMAAAPVGAYHPRFRAPLIPALAWAAWALVSTARRRARERGDG